MGLHDRFHQAINALPRKAGQRDDRATLDLRQEARGLFLQHRERGAAVLDQIPLVEADDDRPPLAFAEVDDCQVLLLEGDRRIQQDDHDLGEFHRTNGICRREFLDLVLDSGALAQAGSVENLDLATAPFPVEADGIASDARFRPGQKAFLIKHGVDKGRFARVRAADDSDADRPGNIVLGAFLILAERRQAGFLARVCFRFCLHFGRHVDHGPERVVEFPHAVAVFGGDRHRFAEAKFVGVDDPSGSGLALGLVGADDHGCIRSADDFREKAIVRRDAGAGIDHEQHAVGGGDARLCLLAHAGGQRAFRGFLKTGRVDYREAQVRELGIALATVTCHARPVIDQREFLAHQPVEQGRLADIGPADQCEGEGHGASDQGFAPAGPERTTASRISAR